MTDGMLSGDSDGVLLSADDDGALSEDDCCCECTYEPSDGSELDDDFASWSGWTEVGDGTWSSSGGRAVVEQTGADLTVAYQEISVSHSGLLMIQECEVWRESTSRQIGIQIYRFGFSAPVIYLRQQYDFLFNPSHYEAVVVSFSNSEAETIEVEPQDGDKLTIKVFDFGTPLLRFKVCFFVNETLLYESTPHIHDLGTNPLHHSMVATADGGYPLDAAQFDNYLMQV